VWSNFIFVLPFLAEALESLLLRLLEACGAACYMCMSRGYMYKIFGALFFIVGACTHTPDTSLLVVAVTPTTNVTTLTTNLSSASLPAIGASLALPATQPATLAVVFTGKALPVLLAETVNDWNRHFTGGADSQHLSAKLALARYDSGEVMLLDEGTNRESLLLTERGYEQIITTWKHQWVGSWSEQKGVMILSLTLRAQSCEEISQRQSWAEEKKSCDKVLPALVATCNAMDAPTKSGKKIMSWFCRVEGGSDKAGSPSVWIFGQSTCLTTYGGKMTSMSYKECPSKKEKL
jgi:hypothetical protein